MIEIVDRALRGYRFIDLFCGIGGFHLALESFGAECVFASDIDENAKDVYEQNFGFRPVGDITEIDIADIPDHDIICWPDALNTLEKSERSCYDGCIHKLVGETIKTGKQPDYLTPGVLHKFKELDSWYEK